MYHCVLKRMGMVMLALAVAAPLSASTEDHESRAGWVISVWVADWWASVAGSWTEAAAAQSTRPPLDTEAKDAVPGEDGDDPYSRHYLQIEPGG